MSHKKHKVVIIGATGYAGAELTFFLKRHPHVDLVGLYVSANSVDAGKPLSQLYPKFRGIIDDVILPLTDLEALSTQCDVVFLATAHEVSHDIAPIFLDKGVKVFDLSGAFRVPSIEFYEKYYGFTHKHPEWLDKAVYGLAEFCLDKLPEAQLIAVPGCYPTASQLALKPLIEANLLDEAMPPVINATSGVSGAGRKAALYTSFCEVSLQPYGLFNHRHQPEISHHLGTEVIFTPHLGQFDRGILATITCRIKSGVTSQMLKTIFDECYDSSPIVRVQHEGVPALKSVVGTPYCDIGYAVNGSYAIIVSAEDNLLKGAASQAVQCFNLTLGYSNTLSLF